MVCLVCMGFTYQEDTTIDARQERDECIEMEAGTVLTYSFESSQSLKFDIHRHINETDVITLDKSYGTKKRGPKKVTIDETGVYCLNWKNPYRVDTKLTYRIQFNNPEQ